MTVDLSTVTFENDFYILSLEDGSLLVLNKIDESLLVESLTTNIDVITITHIAYDEDGNGTQTNCTNIIGMSDSYVTLSTTYTEYLGKQLNSDTIQYCTLEV